MRQMTNNVSKPLESENSLIPKYHIIKLTLLNQIDSHELEPGDMIPSEKQLMDQYQASRITVRRAVDLLVAEGYVRKVQGKGTFVIGHEHHPSSGASSCSEIIRRQNHVPTRMLIRKEVDACPEDTAEVLKCAPQSGVLHFERVYCADGKPVIYAVSKVCLTHLPGFEKYDLVNYSMMDIIREDYQYEFQKSSCVLRAVVTDGHLAEIFHVKEGFPLLYYSGVTDGVKNGSAVPLEIFTLYYRTDVVHFLPEML